MDGLTPCHKLWVERDGRIVMSDYRVRLLELIAETGSLAQAAQSMGLSYRRAWGKVKEIEQNLGLALVTSEVGGPGGGHTVLTEEGREFVAAYRRYQERVARAVAQAFEAEFSSLEAVASRIASSRGT